MAISSGNIPTTIQYPLSQDDALVEAGILAKLAERQASFTGSARDGYDQMSAMTPVESNVRFQSIDAGGVKGLWAHPQPMPTTNRAILFIHGGAYLVGSAAGYKGFASQIASRTGISTFALDYPLAPENPFPAAYNAVIAALNWLHTEDFSQIAIVGDSAGGGLALASLGDSFGASMRVTSTVVFSAWVDLTLTGNSFNDPATHDPLFTPAFIGMAASKYLAGANAIDGRVSPLFAVPEVVPPLLLQVGVNELLLDDSCRYADAAANRRGPVRLEIYEGLHHVFQRCVVDLAAARHAFDNAANFITAHWH